MKKNIAYSIFSDGIAGAEIVVRDIIRFIDKDKFNVFLIVNDEIKDLALFKNINIKVYNIGNLYTYSKIEIFDRVLRKLSDKIKFKKYLLKYKAKKIVNFLKRNKIDLIHSHLEFDMCFSYYVKKYYPEVKTIFTVHSQMGFDNKYRLKTYFSVNENIKFLKSFEKLTVVCDYLKDLLVKYGFHEKKIIKIFNAVNHQDIYEYKKEIKITKDKVIFIFMGGNKKLKGGELLVESVYNIVNVDKIKNLIVYILGNINKSDIIYKKINDYRLNSHFKIIGKIKSPNQLEYINESDVLILPSYTEAMPLTVIEALTMNKAIIATKVGGVPELILNNKNGIICNPDINSLQNAIKKILKNQYLIQEFSLYNKTIEKKYFWNKRVLDYEKLYERVLSK